MPQATIQKCKEIVPITEANSIELAKVLGWQCVVKRGEFQPGDIGCYIEIDTIVPDTSVFEFMKPRGFRVKTAKFLKKYLSQGLFLPLSLFPEIINPQEGDEVDEIISVTKYEKPVPVNSEARGNFPPSVLKTDEINIQSDPELIDALRGRRYVITLKMDGTSATYGYFPNNKKLGMLLTLPEGQESVGTVVPPMEFHACSRNLSVKDGNNIYWHMARKYNIAHVLELVRTLGDDFIIQGEIVGLGVQGNHMGESVNKLLVFNVLRRREGMLPDVLEYQESDRFCTLHEFETVPLVERGDGFQYTMIQLLEMADVQRYKNGHLAEGIVVRSDDHSQYGLDFISFKAVSNNYRLRHGE